MNNLDWIILIGTVALIVFWGIYLTRKQQNLDAYLKGGNSDNWLTIGLSVMATQASAITFLSATGQGYESGLGFVQFYFGLPLAIILISAFIIPIYYKLNVFTAYEYLENRFDLKTRLFTAFLFLVSRGFAAGITIFAPSIVLSTLFHWSLEMTIIITGITVILYTASGGSKAVSATQKQQMLVIFLGLFLAFYLILESLPQDIGFKEAMQLAGLAGHLEVVNTTIDTNTRYTLWSGLLGGFFLSLSYFGTDQSQVQRYISGSNINQSRIGLLFNAAVKIPMQFFILLIGVLLFAFYQFQEVPPYFNQVQLARALQTEQADSIKLLSAQLAEIDQRKEQAAIEASKVPFGNQNQVTDTYSSLLLERREIQKELRATLGRALPAEKINDTDYVFLQYVLHHFPAGVIGLLLAVILSAAMSSTAGELNALASTTMVDFYGRLKKQAVADNKKVLYSKLFTVLWGIIAIVFALSASLFENLIQLVNIIGSLFYGTILGVFICGFFIKKFNARQVFPAAVLAEVGVIIAYLNTDWSFLWLNPLGCLLVVVISSLIFVANPRT